MTDLKILSARVKVKSFRHKCGYDIFDRCFTTPEEVKRYLKENKRDVIDIDFNQEYKTAP